MIKVINDNTRVPIKLWLNDIEEGALKQANNAANLPFIFHHLAIMPDAHQGYGVSIGSVLATERVVIPNAVGVDVGCGLIAVKTSLKSEQLNKDTLKKIMNKIREQIPIGIGKDGSHKEKQDESLMPDGPIEDNSLIICKEYNNALIQLGTLGSGNHFIEIQKDINDNIWIMIHSGSRNLGKKVADHYNKLAKELNERWHSKVPREWDLAFLPIETQEAKNYMTEMQYCVDFAFANRRVMMNRIVNIFVEEFKLKDFEGYQGFNNLYPELASLKNAFSFINIAHNYAVWENHFGQNVIVHRKGATLARKDTIGIIPGSQGAKSYIVKGLGNKDSFESCSHGAGRKMGRKVACKTLNLEEEIKKMNDLGIIHGIRNENNLDEAPGAYKDISEVMNNQKDLVEIIETLTPLAVIKGD